jgi:hypothetical protein
VEDFSLKKKIAIAAAIILSFIIMAAGTYAVLLVSRTVPSTGRITTINVGVYGDSAATQALTSIDWGNLTAGTSTTYSFYIKNPGNIRETLSMSTSGWTPATASQYITITWDRTNTALNPNEVIMATLTLTVNASIDTSITTFSNNITITGTG